MGYSTEQEAFWRNEFGDEYALRNRGPALVASNTALFSEILTHTCPVSSVLELGANIGLNLRALRALLPLAQLSAVEINHSAAQEVAKALPEAQVFETSILEFEPANTWELVFTKGVLIHIDPQWLPTVYDLMYRASSRYLLVSEYYNPSPVEVEYRGHAHRLFKRDFAGEILERFEDLRLVQYGFVYRRDPNFPQDDTTWFLMEKR